MGFSHCLNMSLVLASLMSMVVSGSFPQNGPGMADKRRDGEMVTLEVFREVSETGT